MCLLGCATVASGFQLTTPLTHRPDFPATRCGHTVAGLFDGLFQESEEQKRKKDQQVCRHALPLALMLQARLHAAAPVPRGRFAALRIASNCTQQARVLSAGAFALRRPLCTVRDETRARRMLVCAV